MAFYEFISPALRKKITVYAAAAKPLKFLDRKSPYN